MKRRLNLIAVFGQTGALDSAAAPFRMASMVLCVGWAGRTIIKL